MQLEALVAIAHMAAVGLAVAHGVAREGTAVAGAARVDEARAGHADDAAVGLGDLAADLADAAERGRGLQAQARRVFHDDEHAAVGAAFHARDHNLILRVDREHLLALDGADAGAVVREGGLVDVDAAPAGGEDVGMLLDIRLHARHIHLPEEVIKRDLFLAHALGVRERGVAGLDLLLVPLAVDADLRLPGRLHFGNDLVDDAAWDERRGQPLVAERVHGRLDIGRAPLGDERNVGIHRRQVQAREDGQHKEQDQQPAAETLFLLRLFGLLCLAAVLAGRGRGGLRRTAAVVRRAAARPGGVIRPLAGIGLPGRTLLRGALLRGTLLRGALLGRALLGRALLRGTLLRGTLLRGTLLGRALLGRALLGGIGSGSLRARGARRRGKQLQEATPPLCTGDYEGLDGGARKKFRTRREKREGPPSEPSRKRAGRAAAQQSCAPAGTLSSSMSRLSLPSFSAERSIPLEAMPIILRGGRFRIATTVLPTSSSGR